MRGILILGAGGHAKVVADILLSRGFKVAGFLDDQPATWNTQPLNIAVLGPNTSYADYDPAGIVIGIGSNTTRRKIAIELGEQAPWHNAIHASAIVADSVTMGVGVVMAAGAIINPDSHIGDHVIINTGATVDHDCQIGSFCHIAPGAHLAGSVKIGEGTLVGIGAVVLPGCKIGQGVTVGGGSVVVDDLPDEVIVKGIPAR